MIDALQRVFPAALVARFLSAGAAVAVAGAATLYLLVDVCGLHYLLGAVGSWATAMYLSYVSNSRWVFRAALSITGIWKFTSTRLVTTAIGFGLYAVFVEMGLWYMAASVASTVAVTLGNYLASRYLVWHQ
jgi:putative flippase GtrA